MYYFSYAKDMNMGKALKVYHVVWELKAYAMTIYKSLWQDALDKSFFHIMDNYDEECGGDLEHYATKVVGTILLNKYSHEVEHELSLTTALDQKSFEANFASNPLDLLLADEEEDDYTDVNECIKYLLPMFIKDFRFFKTRKSEYRKLSYTGLFRKYSEKTVSKAMDYLVDTYGEDMDSLLELSKSTRLRNFPNDRYKKSLDPTVEYKGMFNNILLYSSLNGKYKKIFYSFSIREAVVSIISYFYLVDDSICYKKIGNIDVYCSLSGQLVYSIEDLYDCIEREVVGAILAKSPHLKVVCYEKGVNMILSSPKEEEYGLVLNIFGENFATYLQRIVAKRM